VAFLAQLDADTIPHPLWLRELATALADPQVGAATGNRWYMPQRPSVGAMVRYAWNAAAIVQMYWYRIAWGGTLAVKTQVIRESGLLDLWGQAFCEDTMLFRELGERRWQVRFVPSLMMVNREGCSVGGFFSWVRRQLLTARLYHPRWAAVAAHGLGTAAVQLAAACALIGALALADYPAAWLLASGLFGYQASMLILLPPMEWLVRRIAAARGEPVRWFSLRALIRLAAAVPLLQVLYPWSVARTLRVRSVDWRGVQYRISGPWQIELVEYQPFAAQTGPLSEEGVDVSL
jgi:hypothetical protein